MPFDSDIDSTLEIDTVLGAGDTISGNAGSDILIGGTGVDTVYGDDVYATADTTDHEDIIVGDQAEILLTDNVVDHILTTTRETEAAGDFDILIGAHGDDILIGGAGGDFIDGGDAIRAKADGADNDDLIFGDHVELNRRPDGTVTDPRFQVLLGQMLYSRYDLPAFLQGPVDVDGEPLFDAYPASGDDAGQVLVDGVARDYRTVDADGNELQLPSWAEWVIVDLDHSQSIEDNPLADNRYGNDYIAGGNANDVIFGQLGNDTVQGDGSIETAIDADENTEPVSATRDQSVTSDLTPTLSVTAYEMSLVASYEQADDGDDYIEGMGGDDVIFGNLGQDDIIGDNSSLFTLDTLDERLPNGSDIIFGGSGERADHDHDVIDTNNDTIILEDVHARDADVIAGDNANIYRIVGTADVVSPESVVFPGTGELEGFLSFGYDEARIDGLGADLNNQLIIVRAVELLDYTPGGPDYDAANAALDIGGADEVHGESGDDFVYGMVGADILFGDSEDDDIIGGWGPDWISGGQDMDGVIGDDGRIYTARYMDLIDTSKQGNKVTSDLDPADPADYAELLNGVFGVDELNKEIRTPGNIQQAIIHPTLVLDDLTVTDVGEIFKTVDLTPFNLTPMGQMDDPLFEPLYANDIIFGGLGNDFLHGSAGDDAMSGAEALPLYFNAPVNPDDPETVVPNPERTADNASRPDDLLGFLPDRIEFYDYDEEAPRAKLVPFLLNFDASGDPHPDETDNDNFDEDQIFGDLGNDWMVGGPDNDHMFGGFGSDLMDADDNKDTDVNPDDGIPFDNYGPDPINIDIQDRAYGGAGRDVLIANTGGDRLMDWIGEFNSFIVPFAPFGEFTVTRAVSPHIFDFLYDLSEALGADPTRAVDTGNAADRNGEPDGELGLITQKDGQLWKDQTGAPIDPQPGNIPGGKRLTLRGVDFNDGTQQAFTADSGVWEVKQGRFHVSPEVRGANATAVFHVGEYIPNYFELLATISTSKTMWMQPTSSLPVSTFP
jgi:Ca2+-binding RTX toxin-like protein